MVASFEQASRGVLDSAAALDERIRSLYDLKSYRGEKPAEVAQVLLKAVDTTTSVLLQHEFLYNVGQIGLAETIPQLQAIIGNHDQYDVVSRHEAIESMGAIGLASATTDKDGKNDALDFLVSVQNDAKSEQPIVESCVLAVERIRRISTEGPDAFAIDKEGEFVSVDPTPASQAVKSIIQEIRKQRALVAVGKATAEGTEALEKKVTATCKDLGKTLSDEKASLWDRYQAMFGLRDIGSNEAVAELCSSLRTDKSSALFRHEVAFVLGQLENPSGSPALIESLKDEEEHAMVRHEAAEALGAVANKSDWDILEEYAKHKEPLVKDSCVVALDMHKYWTNFHHKDNSKAEEECDEQKPV